MKKVLFISYLFPPLSCGICRQSKIPKYLPDFGWKPILLTVKKSRVRPIYDNSLLKDTKNVTIFRTYSFESKLLSVYIPFFMQKYLKINYKYFQIVDPFVGWIPFAVFKGIEIIKKENIDLLLSTSMPISSHIVALILKKLTKLPWVADFRDQWTQNPYINYPKPVLKIENCLENLVITNANKVTTINNTIRNDLIEKYRKEPEKKFVVIPHGFDLEDFKNIKTKKTKKFTISYTGSIYGRRVTAAKMFLESIKSLLNENENLKKNVKILFIGNMSYKILKYIEKNNILKDLIVIKPPLPHQEALQYMKSSDVLLLIIGYNKKDASISTGKLFEYLATRKYVLGLGLDSSEAAKLIKHTNIGKTIDPRKKKKLEEELLSLYEKYKKNKLNIRPKKSITKKYNIKFLTREFAEIFNNLIQKRQ